MKPRLLTMFATLALLCSALRAEIIKLRMSEAADLAAALVALDSQMKVIPQGDAPAKLVMVPYDFTGKTRLTLALDFAKLKPLVEGYDTTKRLIFQAASPEGTGIKPGRDQIKYLDEMEQIAHSTITVELTRIAVDQLKLDTNPIPSTVLAALSPIFQP